MKYIITESQYKILTEGKLELFNSILNHSLKSINIDCIDINASSFPDDLSYQSCDESEWVSKVKVINFEWSTTERGGGYKKDSPLLILTVDVELFTVNRFEPNTLMFDLSKRIADVLGSPVVINIDNVITKGNEW